MPYDRPLFKAFTAIFVVNLSHLSVEIITFKNKITTGKKISIEKKNSYRVFGIFYQNIILPEEVFLPKGFE